MKLIACAAAVAVCLSMPAFAASSKPKPGPACPTLEMSKTAAGAAAARFDGVVSNLDGPEAKKLLDIINAIGTPTAFRADHVGVMIAPKLGTGMVLLAVGPCGGYAARGVILPIPVLLDAYAKVRGIPHATSTAPGHAGVAQM